MRNVDNDFIDSYDIDDPTRANIQDIWKKFVPIYSRGNFAVNSRTLTSGGTLDIKDSTIFADTSSGNITLILQSANAWGSAKTPIISIYKTSTSNLLYVAPATGETIDVNGMSVDSNGIRINSNIVLVSNGVNKWYTITIDNATTPSYWKNLLINGDFRFSQRSYTTAATGAYSVDRWYHNNQTAAVTPTLLSDVSNGLPSMLRITQSNAASQRFGITQTVETRSCRDLRGSLVTLSGTVRCSNTTNIKYAILEWTSTADGTATVNVVNSWTSTNYTAGNFFAAANITVAAVGTVAVTANTLTPFAMNALLSSAMNNLIVFIWTETTQAQNSTLDFGVIKLEEGAVATPYEWRPAEVERSLCERYYQSWINPDGTLGNRPGIRLYAYANAAVNIGGSWTLNTRMRAAPTATIVGGWTLTNCTAVGVGVAKDGAFELYATGAAAGFVDAYPGGNGDGLTLDAEL